MSPRIFVLTFVLELSTAMAQNEPDMDNSGCVDLVDAGIFQDGFGTIARPGESRCDLNSDGFCDFEDYALFMAVFGGPACACATDADCDDDRPCAVDDRCAGVECRASINCPNQDDNDADCLHQYCDGDGCFSLREPDGSPCDDGLACTEEHCEDGICRSEPDDSVCGGLNDADGDCTHGYCGPNGCVQGSEPFQSRCVQGSPSVEDYYDADCGYAICIGSFCFDTPEGAGAPCQDGLGCTISDVCDDAYRCIGRTSTCGNENDNDADCQRAECTPDGCQFLDEQDESPCDDGIACTVSDYCFVGQCYSGIADDSLCPNRDICDNDCLQYYCHFAQGCVQTFEPERAPCRFLSCGLNGTYAACTNSGFCTCWAQPPPDWGCPP